MHPLFFSDQMNDKWDSQRQNSPTYKLETAFDPHAAQGEMKWCSVIRQQWCWHLPRFACTQPKYKLKITAFDPKAVFSDNSLYRGSPPLSLICLQCFPSIHLDQLSPAPNWFFYFGTVGSTLPRAQRRIRLEHGAPFPRWPCRSNQWSARLFEPVSWSLSPSGGHFKNSKSSVVVFEPLLWAESSYSRCINPWI